MPNLAFRESKTLLTVRHISCRVGTAFGHVPVNPWRHFVGFPFGKVEQRIGQVINGVLRIEDVIPGEQESHIFNELVNSELYLSPDLGDCQSSPVSLVPLTQAKASPIFSIVSSTSLISCPAMLQKNCQPPSA